VTTLAAPQTLIAQGGSQTLELKCSTAELKRAAPLLSRANRRLAGAGLWLSLRAGIAQANALNSRAAKTAHPALRSGAAGHLLLEAMITDDDADSILAMSRVWQSVTDYRPTRHLKRVSSRETLIADIRSELRKLNLLPT
jgi:hypothetical protein